MQITDARVRTLLRSAIVGVLDSPKLKFPAAP